LVGLSGTLAAWVGSGAASGDSQARELAAAIHEEALRLSALVVNLLDMARLQAGGVVLDRQWQPIEEVVGSALRASARVLAGHRVETNLAVDLPLVAFDAVLIERVLCNLLDNAAKYTPAGSRIGLAAGVQGDHLEVRVTDDGPGLPEGLEDRIFDKFTRGEQESARPGVGLGLAICRAIVQAHGGRIRAANRPDGGAQFSFTLPLGAPPNLEAEPESPAAPAPPPASGGSEA
jgi:two-component system sensor histidine kinase KdpD